ncbi:RagB/SusD family nutrient uptake outer membrane protein [Pedobacter rhodius]|uniref:RagB/SusD family nutrient uptake outer membrane protein n=1 Tax=Pedobacter rhodius TaxID=3004098 RepID=A0ABT4KUF4_9SPHI|nr:RagB/SusD family nutrient uptake outer membrane protein [Pedobacter sp. SJ11]MCZ4222551.1 RagB/SusD family nutrient uptake outer membrane protein [Pedobacter sp. SJ11]
MKLKTIYSACYLIIASTMLAMVTGCEKDLNLRPSKGSGVVITQTSDLDALLNNYTSFCNEINRTAIYSTDDFQLDTGIYNALPSRYPIDGIEFGTWDTQYIPTDFSEQFWSGEYSKIYQANLVLSYVNKVTGPDKQKADLAADAYFIRAYSYWELVNNYCLPYSQANLNEPGLPIKLLPNYEESLVRQSLGATYKQIQNDLNEALKTTVPLVQNGVNRSWRANITAVNAFAARFYLSIGDYAAALKYANASLSSYSTLVDYNSGMRYGTPASVTVTNKNGTKQTVTIQYPYTHDRTDVSYQLTWPESTYFRVLNFGNSLNWFIPSQALLNLYDKTNDLRYKYNIVQNFSYVRGLINPAYGYPGYIFYGETAIPLGPTTAEMYLIKAECLARTNDVPGAMAAVNVLHRARTVTGSPDLIATTQAAAITSILEERRREMPFRQRWSDVKRLNNNDYAGDNVAPFTRLFYQYNSSSTIKPLVFQTFTLPVNSRRFAVPIPQNDINNSNGQITQNTY